jgi:hypothetical protein
VPGRHEGAVGLLVEILRRRTEVEMVLRRPLEGAIESKAAPDDGEARNRGRISNQRREGRKEEVTLEREDRKHGGRPRLKQRAPSKLLYLNENCESDVPMVKGNRKREPYFFSRGGPEQAIGCLAAAR